MSLKLHILYCMFSLLNAANVPINSRNVESNVVTSLNEYILENIFFRSDTKQFLNSCSILEQMEVNSDNRSSNDKVEFSDTKINTINKTEDNVLNEITEEELVPETFVDIFNQGKIAYLSNDWLGCISLIERAIVLYQDYYNALTYCRVFCDVEVRNIKPTFVDNYQNYHFFEGILRKTLCLEKCRLENLKDYGKFFTLGQEDKMFFRKRTPYNYLQICYYKNKEIEKAINAAMTALIGNPEDKMLLKNIKFYSSLKEFDYETIQDLEDKEFSQFYVQGIDEYNKQNWKVSIENFEKFIQLWIQEFDKCRAFCEDSYYEGWLPDFTSSIANVYVFTLRCKQSCRDELAHVKARRYNDVISQALDHLQYAYYQAGDIKNGAKCVASYLFLHPNSDDMKQSYEYYSNLTVVNEKSFQVREDIKRLGTIQNYESHLLNYVDNDIANIFKLLKEDENIETEESNNVKESEEITKAKGDISKLRTEEL